MSGTTIDAHAPPTWDIDPYAPEVLVDFEAWYDGLRQRGRAVWLSRYDCWAIGHFDVVRTVFADWRRFGSARGIGVADFAREKPWRPPSIILEVDPPDHARTRKVMMRTMTPRRASPRSRRRCAPRRRPWSIGCFDATSSMR